jgi:hypothetical protein
MVGRTPTQHCSALPGRLARASPDGWLKKLLIVVVREGAAWPHRFEHAGSSGPFACGKGTVWDGGVRVPAIAWWPGVIQPAATSTAALSTLDVFPSFISLAGAPPSSMPTARVMDGIDISAFLLSSGQPDTLPAARAFFWYRLRDTMITIRTGPDRLRVACALLRLAMPILIPMSVRSRYLADQLAAARVGRYKVHWLRQGWGRSWVPFPQCGPENATRLDPPQVSAWSIESTGAAGDNGTANA